MILCVDNTKDYVNIPLNKSNEDVVEQVASHFITNKKKYFEDRREIDFSLFHFVNKDNRHVDNISSIVPGQVYRFALPSEITVESAFQWTEAKLQSLGIEFTELNNILQLSNVLTFDDEDWVRKINEESDICLASLSALDDEFTRSFLADKMSENVLTSLSPLIKSVLTVKKHPYVASYVDLMITFLLNHCGFYGNSLFAFPHFPFKIFFGKMTADAKSDFTIFDLLKSYYRIAVVLDKVQDDPNIEVNVEANLIAEAIAMAQANEAIDKKVESNTTKKQKIVEDIVLGIRVRDTRISFYVIPITDAILDALRTCTSSLVSSTQVRRTIFFDLIYPPERKEIFKFLCCYRMIAEQRGVCTRKKSST